jgi:SAM-dependent methyltransferase
MKWFVDTYASKMPQASIKVLDVGSCAYNGHDTYKSLFPTPRYEYCGLDMLAGPNVDVVEVNPYRWKDLRNETFDVVISGQTFEHTEFFWVTIAEMARVLKKDGLLCLIAPNGFGEHRYPVDCYRFFADEMVSIARYVGMKPLHAHTNCAPSAKDKDWYSMFCANSMLVAQKPYSGEAQYVDLNSYVCVPPEQGKLRGGMLPQRRTNLLARLIRKTYGFAMRKLGLGNWL